MPNLTFATKGAAEVIAQQEKLNKAAEKGAAAYHDTTRAAKEAGDQIQKNSKTGERAQDRVTDSVRKTGTEYKRMSAEQRQQARTAEAIMRRNETAQERYNRLVKQARTALTGTKNASELYRREVDALNREMNESTGRFSKFAASQETSFGAAALARVGAYAAGIVSVSSAMQMLNRQVEAQQRLNDQANQSQLGVSETRNVVIRNLVGSSDAQIAEVLDQNRQLANQLRVSERYVNLARADALSATGGDVDASLEAVGVAARFLRDRPDELNTFTGALLDLSRATGTTDATVNLGYLATVASLSRVVSPQEQARNIPRAIIGQIAFGATPQESAALFAALTTGSADFSGSTSATGSISLAQQLQNFNPDSSLTETIRSLQQNREQRDAFLDSLSLERTVLGPARQLLTDPDSDISRTFERYLTQIPGQQGLARFGEQALSSLNVNTLNRVADRRRAIETSVENIEASGPSVSRQLTSDERTAVRDTILRETRSDVYTWFSFWLRSIDRQGFTESDAISALTEARTELEYRGGPGSAQGISNIEKLLEAIRDNSAETNRKLDDSGLVGVAQ